MRESMYQQKLKRKIKNTFDGCIVLKNDANYLQGIPDLLILYKNKWAMLEVKNDIKAHKQPNQEYYVNKCNKMSFSKFIYPQNEEEVLDELAEFFRA